MTGSLEQKMPYENKKQAKMLIVKTNARRPFNIHWPK